MVGLEYPAADAVRPLEVLRSSELSVQSFDVDRVDLDFYAPMHLPFGTVTSRPSGWVTLQAKVGERQVTGQGEGATLPEPLFTDDSGHNIVENSTELLEQLSGTQAMNFGEALNRIWSYAFKDGGRYPTARLAVEMSLIDAVTKASDLSVSQMIGLPEEVREVTYGKSIGAETTATIVAQAREAIANRSSKIKIKVSPTITDEVISAVHELRSSFPQVEYMVDANGTFDPGNEYDVAKLKELDDLNLSMIEEPVSRAGKAKGLGAVRLLLEQMSFRTPVCLDDCLETIEQADEVVVDGTAQVVNIKPGRIGSFVKSLDLIDRVSQLRGQVMVGGMFEATPGRCMTTILGAYCALKGSDIPGDLSLAQERLTEDLVPPSKQLQYSPAGNIMLPKGKGWGFSE